METAPSPEGGENLPVAPVSWLESKLKPKTIHHRYPFKGKPLLWMTCAFGSLGDALFGYDQGTLSTTSYLSPCILHSYTDAEPRHRFRTSG